MGPYTNKMASSQWTPAMNVMDECINHNKQIKAQQDKCDSVQVPYSN